MTRVAVIGGGIIGSLCAYELAKAGADVVLFHNDGGGATEASAAMLEAQLDAKRGDPFNTLSFASRDMFPRLHAELLKATGIDIQYEQCGILQGAVDDSDAEALKAEAARQTANGWSARFLDAAEVALEYPPLRLPFGAIAYEQDGQVNATRFLEAARTAAARAGARLLLDAGEAELALSNGTVTGVRARESVDADVIVVATGAWTDRLLAPLDVRLGIEPIRGQLLWHKSPGHVLPIPVYTRHAFYVVPKRDGFILAGTTDEKAGFDASTTPAGEQEIAAATGSMMPDIASYPVLCATSGLRPGSPDGLPFLGPLPGHSNVIIAAGHHRNGILLAPISAVIVTDLVTGRKPPVNIAPFLPSRALAPR